ncbi:M91 family zinc metallopeptidase [Candidatus Protochlamydia phocaeensis]|uniref:M91 family zinc metallopeptidase n=1 Tax=Candidatus Protochlamydia phocaeensis TaxID=1414722 RepID=UPI000838243E|nr:M91 family zinc metallopeptidase [Candidatus Protochlamydia phocaeensis]
MNPLSNNTDLKHHFYGLEPLNKEDNFSEKIKAENLGSQLFSSFDRTSNSLKKDRIQKLGATEQPVSNTDNNDQMKAGKNQLQEIVFKSIQDPSHLFFGTDLIVFKNEYKGLMPLNGIKENELHRIVLLHQQIIQQQTPCLIETSNKKEIGEMLKLLMTRKLGRALIDQIIPSYKNENKNLVIKLTSDSGSRFLYRDTTPTIEINENDPHSIMRSPTTGELQPLVSTSFITLGHELIHALHYIQNPLLFSAYVNAEPLQNSRFHNLEEEETITTHLISPFNSNFEEINFEEITRLEENGTLQEHIFFTENSLRSVFGFPLRFDHHILPSLELINNQYPRSEARKLYFDFLIQAGVLEQVKKWVDCTHENLNLKIIDRYPIDIAIQARSLEVIDYLLGKIETQGVLNSFIKSQDIPFISFIIAKYKFNVNEVDKSGLTPLQTAFCCSKKNILPMVKFLISQGANDLSRIDQALNILNLVFTKDDRELILYVWNQTYINWSEQIDGLKSDFLFKAVSESSFSGVEFLMDQYPELCLYSTINQKQELPIQSILSEKRPYYDFLPIFKFLYEKMNQDPRFDSIKQTLLFSSIVYKKSAIVEFLFDQNIFSTLDIQAIQYQFKSGKRPSEMPAYRVSQVLLLLSDYEQKIQKIADTLSITSDQIKEKPEKTFNQNQELITSFHSHQKVAQYALNFFNFKQI